MQSFRASRQSSTLLIAKLELGRRLALQQRSNVSDDIVWRLICDHGDEAAMATYLHLAYSVCTTGLLLPAYF